jgi:hypothetical protein
MTVAYYGDRYMECGRVETRTGNLRVPPGPWKERRMPTFRLEDEQGRWLTNTRLNAPAWKPGDTIPRGRDNRG